MDEQVKAAIGDALGRVVSGCFVLTAQAGEESTGMLASWVQQAGFDPPTVTACVKKARPIERLIDESGHFVLNVIGDDPSALFKHFGKGFEPGEDAFVGLDVDRHPAGVALTDCPGHLGCRVIGKHDAGDHWLYLAEVIGGRGDAERPPYVHIRKNGFSY